MSFEDGPKVDNSAKRSQESELKVKAFFTLKNGFMCKEKIPDYGFDIDIELLDEKNETTGDEFVIQIKSKKKLTVIRDDLISFKFKTSRLGCIARKKPGLGLVILYDAKTKKSYYDYIEEIIKRLNNERGSESWKDQDKVNIHIPLTNCIDEQAIKSIYWKFKLRFENYNLLLQKHGRFYNLPVFTNKENKDLDFISNLELIAPKLINEERYDILHEAFSKLTTEQVRNSYRLCFYAAIVFCETGDIIEAKHYVDRTKQVISKLNDIEKEIFSLTELKVDSISGNIGLSDFHKLVSENIDNIQSPLNIVNLKINDLESQVYNVIYKCNFNKNFENDLITFFNEIEQLNIAENHKISFFLKCCDIILIYNNSFAFNTLTIHKISEQIGIAVSTEEKLNLWKRSENLMLIVNKYLKQIDNYLQKSKNNLLYAELLVIRSKYFLNTLVSNYSLNNVFELNDEFLNDYENNTKNLSLSYKVFIKNLKYQEAHLALNLSLEIRSIFQLIFELKPVEKEEKKIRKKIKEIETETGIKEYKSSLQFIQGIKEIKSKSSQNSIQKVKLLTDSEIENLARLMLDSEKLPEERLQNLITDMKNHRKFYKSCNNNNLLLLQNKITHQDYKFPVSYIIKNIQSGIETVERSNIDELLEMVQHLLDK